MLLMLFKIIYFTLVMYTDVVTFTEYMRMPCMRYNNTEFFKGYAARPIRVILLI